MDESLILLIYDEMKQKSSEELLLILEKNDKSVWSEEAFGAIKKILSERGDEITEIRNSNGKKELAKTFEESDKLFCSKCGSQLPEDNSNCINCGTRVQNQQVIYSAKNKVLAIVLSIIFGPWAWLYTYGKNRWQFWASIGIMILTSIPIAISPQNYVFTIIRGIAVIALRIWPIAYYASKPDEFYLYKVGQSARVCRLTNTQIPIKIYR